MKPARPLILFILYITLSWCTPIVEKLPDKPCISPGVPCSRSDQACCPGYECTQIVASEKAYCIQVDRPPFIMARSNVLPEAPKFMGMDISPSGGEHKSLGLGSREDCMAPGSACSPDAPNSCCAGSSCQELDHSFHCVEHYPRASKDTHVGKRDSREPKLCEYEIQNPGRCVHDDDCCGGYYCDRSSPGWTIHYCEPIQGTTRLPWSPTMAEHPASWTRINAPGYSTESLFLQRRGPIHCQDHQDCPHNFMCLYPDLNSLSGLCTAPEQYHGLSVKPRGSESAHQEEGDNIQKREYDQKKYIPMDSPCYPDIPTKFCPDSHCDPMGGFNPLPWSPGSAERPLLNRRDMEAMQHNEGKKKTEFPKYPTAWCTQEGCPCYYSSPCEMGVCDNYDERLIGKCRKFRPGEGDDLQPGFPIDMVRCTYTGCPCNKWYDHCWKGACDGVNRPGFGKCRPFHPMEEPRNNRKTSEDCTDVGCVCDGEHFPCKNSQCVIKGVNKYGRCRRFDFNGNLLHTRQEFDPKCRSINCPCTEQSHCLQGTCSDYNENGVGKCRPRKISKFYVPKHVFQKQSSEG